MKKFFLALVAMFAITAVASAANYTADDAAIDAAIENAIDVNAFNLGDTATAPLGAAYVAMGNNDMVSSSFTQPFSSIKSNFSAYSAFVSELFITSKKPLSAR